MNPATIAMRIPEGIGALNIAEMLSLPSLAADKPSESQDLSARVQELFNSVAAALERLVVRAIEQRTNGEFCAIVREVFPKYFEGALGLSFLAHAFVSAPALEALSNENFSMMEAEFRDQALAAFGACVRDQAIFSVWTLRKISDVCRKIASAPIVSPDKQKEDYELFEGFSFHAMRNRFHLDCLLTSMKLQRRIYPDVLETIIDGLRSAVDAYAWARRALELRSPVIEPDAPPARVWDEEDDQLLADATYDMVADPA